MWLDLFLISIIICFVIDISGIVDSIKKLIWKWVFNGKKEYQDFSLKPFDCSQCLIWWVGLFFTIPYFSLVNLGLVCLFAALSENISNMFKIIKYLISWVQDYIILLITNKR